MNQASMPRPSGANDFTRYGCFPMRIGVLVEHKLTQGIALPSGRALTPGQKIHLDVQDITRHPQAEGHTHWVCRHPECKSEKWATKKALLAAHADNRELKARQEVHCFYAVAHVPAMPEKPAVNDKQGNPISEAVPAKPASVILLSDEE